MTAAIGAGAQDVGVLVAHPRSLLCDALSRTLGAAPRVDVVASTATLAGLREHCHSLAPQVVLTSPAFGDGELIGVIGEVLRLRVRILVLCESGGLDSVTPLLFAGASGCQFWQDCGPDELVAAVRSVAAGHAALHPAAAAAVLRQWREMRQVGVDVGPEVIGGGSIPALTVRERDVLVELARGGTTRNIAGELAVSPKTVETHIARILTKLGARNRAQAISIARTHELLGGYIGSTVPPERR